MPVGPSTPNASRSRALLQPISRHIPGGWLPHELEPFKARKFAAARRPVRSHRRRHALLGREDLGEIAVGAAADFVVVTGDPSRTRDYSRGRRRC